MKNKIVRSGILLGLCLLICFSFFSCKEKKTFSVSFEWNNGSEKTVISLAEGATPSVPETPDYYGYVFAGWFADADLTVSVNPAELSVNADVTYYAAWTADTAFRVSFQTKGGSAVAPQTVKKGDKIDRSAIAVPTKEGYTFDNWYKNESCTALYNFDVVPTDNMTLYAGWTLNAGMGECVGIVGGKEIARSAFPAGAPVLPTTDNGVSYVWYADPSYNEPFAMAEVSSSVKVYGIAYTDGLEISGGVVTGYTGNARNVVVPELWNGVRTSEIAADAFKNSDVKSVTLPETVEKIGNSAFYGCSSLASVNLTSACDTIGTYAFYGCKKLETVGDISGVNVIEEATFLGCGRLENQTFSPALKSVGKYAFADCASISSFDLPDSVISVGEYAFSGCASVTGFHIPRGLVTFGTGALNGCSSLDRLTYSDNNDTASYRVIDGNLYEGGGKKLVLYVQGEKQETSFTLPAGASAIAAYAFSGNTNLTELLLDRETITMEKGALAGMKALETLSIYTLDGDNGYLAYYFGAESGEANGSAGNFSPDTLKKVTLKKTATVLPDYAFYGFTALNEVVGLTNLRKVGKYAFAYTDLVDVVIPATLTAIGEKAFYGCSSVRSFTVEEGNTAYAAFDACLYNKDLTELYLVPLTKTEVSFPTTVKKITSGAFYKSNVKKLTVPASVETMEAGSLAGVLSLEELSVPFIGGSATENRYMIYVFGGSVQSSLQSDGTVSYSIGNTSCTPPSLKKLTVTGALSAIPDFAFAYLSDVAEIVYSGAVSEIGAYAYCRCGLTELTVPDTVTKIGAYAFAAMGELVTATVPGSVGANIGEAIFYNSSSLETVVFEEGVKVIPANAFYPSASRDAKTGELNYYSKLKEITLPSTLEVIGENAFAYAGTSYIGEIGSVYSDLKFTLPAESNLKTVKKNAFLRSSISAISLPACLTEVEEMAFFGCRNLATVTFGNAKDGSSLEKIGGAAFAMCGGLRDMLIYKKVSTAEDLPVIELYVVSSTTENVSYNVFSGSAVPSIYVYHAELYRNAENWDEYDVNIFALETD